VVGHSADSGDAAGARARVSALGVDAGFVHGTVRADQALRPAALVGVALELWQTLAHRVRVLHSAPCVCSTRRGETRIGGSCSGGGFGRSGVADGEGVAHVVADADTVGSVHDDATVSVDSAGARAGVAALLVDAGQQG